MDQLSEESYYFHTLADFAALVKILGTEKVCNDMQQYFEEASNLLRGYYDDN
jgi:hypothetical protein